jgi:uncharacterized protein YodC (DUF2158 family)
MAGKRENFKPGDFVKLRVGGPKMIVDSINDYNQHASCQWFSGSKLNHGTFAPETLEKVAEGNE